MKKPSLSVIMLTLNEEFHIGDAIDNVKDIAQEIFILDSLSSDKTIDIALEKGATVIQRPFTNFGDQWNFALDHFPIKTKWILKMDPDERLSEKAISSIKDIISRNDTLDAYEATFRLWFLGRPLHAKLKGLVRLWKTNKCRFSNVAVNEHVVVNGKIGRIEGIIEHLDSPNLHHWIIKQNIYTTNLAIQKYNSPKLSDKPNLFGSKLQRRMFFAKYFFKIPFRYQIQLIYELFIRGAIRDGHTGYQWVKMRIMIRKWREIKYEEIKFTEQIPIIESNKTGNYHPKILASSLQQEVQKNSKFIIK